MTSTVRRAGAFAVVGTLSLATAGVAGHPRPVVAALAATAPFLLVAGFALSADDDLAVFDLFARPGDRQDGTLYGLAGFSLAAAGLALLSAAFGMPAWVFVTCVFVLTVGNVAANAVHEATGERVLATGGFVVGGFFAGLAGGVLATTLAGSMTTPSFLALAGFLSATGALLGALLRAVLFERDDPLVLLSIGLLLWLLSDLLVEPTPARVAIALGVTAALGAVAYGLDTASIPGTLTGVLLALLTMVLANVGWFAVLVTFFGFGGLAAKFRYEEKRRRGIAEPNEGARGSGNVLANSMVALVAVLAAAASPSHTGLNPDAFLYAFTGSVAAALADTFSSEIGGLYDEPRLITTFERVDPGTDGGVTWQGEVAGLAGAALVAVVALVLVSNVGPAGAGVVVAAGVVGMTVDSLLGATLEGEYLGNQGVNLLATAGAALVGVALAVATGMA